MWRHHPADSPREYRLGRCDRPAPPAAVVEAHHGVSGAWRATHPPCQGVTVVVVELRRARIRTQAAAPTGKRDAQQLLSPKRIIIWEDCRFRARMSPVGC